SRTDWVVRGRYRLAEGILADAFWGRSSLGGEDEDEDEEPDPAEPVFDFRSRSQLGLRLSLEREALDALVLWGEAGYRLQGGDGWADNVSALRAGLRGVGGGGVEGALEREAWAGGETATGYRLKGWTPALLGVSLFGSIESGRRGMPLPALAELPPELGDVLFTDRSATRIGAAFDVGALALAGAWIRMEADVLAPLGFAAERPGEPVGGGERPRNGLVTPGGERTGFEVSGNVPLLLLDGLSATGSAHFWNDEEVWRYLPRRSYDARIAFHDVFLPTENLEVWADVGVRGRDPMAVPIEGDTNPWLDTNLVTVPFDQSWFLRLQIRVVTVRVFVDWENITIRQRNQDYPDRLMPYTRTTYGVRWSLWN
ncbi:MAG: hypothetical protein WDZ89_02865, partial [Gemmatimonadota bacterium]